VQYSTSGEGQGDVALSAYAARMLGARLAAAWCNLQSVTAPSDVDALNDARLAPPLTASWLQVSGTLTFASCSTAATAAASAAFYSIEVTDGVNSFIALATECASTDAGNLFLHGDDSTNYSSGSKTSIIAIAKLPVIGGVVYNAVVPLLQVTAAQLGWTSATPVTTPKAAPNTIPLPVSTLATTRPILQASLLALLGSNGMHTSGLTISISAATFDATQGSFVGSVPNYDGQQVAWSSPYVLTV